MRRKQLAKRVAIAVLSAATVMTAAPVGAFAATNVVSVEASDANAYGSSTAAPADYQTKLDAALKAATIGNSLSSASEGEDIGTALTAGVTSITADDGNTYAMSNYKITGHTAPSFTTTATGGTIVMPVLTVQADLTATKGGTSKAAGTVTFTVDATALTKSEKITAIKAVLEGIGGTSLDPNKDYANADNATSLADKVAKIFGTYASGTVTVDNSVVSNATVLGETIKVGTTEDKDESSVPQITVSQGAVTAATKSAPGSEVVNATVQIKYVSSDSEYDATQLATADQRAKETATYTATIPKLSVTSQDSEYQQKVAAALADVKFTNEDLKYKDATNAAKELTTSDTIASTDAQKVTTGVWKKVGAALNSIGIKEEDYNITLRALTKASHKADGSVQILLDQKRTDDSKDVQYATVTVPITHADDTVAIGDEISAKIVALVKSYVADSKAITPTVEGSAQKKEIEGKLQEAVEKALADTLGGTNTIASEIEKVEVSIPEGGFTPSTASTNGVISKANVTVTFKDDAPAGTSLTDPGKGFWVAAGTKKTQTVFEYDNAENHTHAAGASATAPGTITLYKVNAVAATSLTLPEETAYNTLSGTNEVKVTPKFTPAGANNYTIRWTLSDTDSFKFKAGGSYKTYVGLTATSNNTKDTVTTDKTAFLANDGITMDASSVKPGDTATLTAELIDSDGLVAAKASTTLKAVEGFSDVQNKYDYAYNAINRMAQSEIVIKNGKAEKVAVISGVGDNKFDPDADVTRAQFVTFLYRLAQWESTKVTAKAENANADANISADNLKTKDKDGNVTATFDSFPSFTDAKAQTKFTDVAAGAYYAKAVDWAVANGIAAGKTATTFDPNAVVTRAEAVTFLQRYYAAGQKYNVSSKFADVKSTDFFANAVGWATSIGVTQGKDDTHFAPKDTCSRKEAAAFIFRANRSANIYK